MARCAWVVACLVATLLSACSRGEGPSFASTQVPFEQIVYQTELAPQYGRAPDGSPVLKPGVVSRLRFAIGPRRSSDAMVASRQAHPDIVRSAEQVPLTVAVHCSFCGAQRTFMKDLVYRPSEQKSNTVEFELVADALKPAEVEATGRLEISVFNDRDGREYDRFVVDVLLRPVPDGAPAVVMPFPLPSAGPAKLNEPGADVTIYVHTARDWQSVNVKVRPIHPDALELLAPLLSEPDGSWRTFLSPVDGEQLQGHAGIAFLRLSELSLQGGFARQLRKVGIDATITKSSQEDLTLRETEAMAVHQVVGDVGQTLYRLLFAQADEDDKLMQAMEALETLATRRPADRPLRVQLVTDLALPWQYLHPVGGTIDAQRFWGMRYSVSAHRVNTGARNRLPVVANNARKVVFARYAGASDPTVRLADLQIQQLTALPSELLVVNSREGLLKTAMTEGRADVSAIVAFTHATSGKVLQSSGSSVFVLDEASGAALRFAENDIVTVAELSALANRLAARESAAQRYLSAGPLVVLNACESGGALMALPQLRLQDALFQLGAQGIVTTEVSVWVPLGHAVGTRLIERLGTGQSAADALTMVRRDLLAKHRNALGLLYAYHGEPSLTLRR